jgi:hypothetical protein
MTWAVCDPPQKLLIIRSLKRLTVQNFLSFYSLLMLLSDCDTVVLKGALNYGLWIAIVRFCACNMGSQKSNVPRGHGGWHNGVIILLLLLFITLEFLMAQVKQSIKGHEQVFIEVM